MASSSWLSQNDSDTLDDEMRTQDITTITTAFNNENDNSEEEEQSEIYLSVIWSGGKLGVAYYDAGSCQLHILPTDTSDSPPEFLNLCKVVRMIRPKIVLAWNKQDEVMLDALKKIVSDFDGDGSSRGSSEENHCLLHLMPTTDFDISSCKWRLLNIKLPHMPEFLDETSKIIYMSDMFNFSDFVMVRSTGVLLKYLDRKRVNVELEDRNMTTPIASVNQIKIADLVAIDKDTYKALQIFKKEWHPSVYKAARGGREGFSLFGVFSQCKSSLGSQEMERVFWQPTCNLDTINQRHAAINFLMHPSNDDFVNVLRNHLKHIKNVAKILLKLKGPKTSVNEWEKLYNTAYHAAQLVQVCRKAKIPSHIDIFQKIISTFNNGLLTTITVISNVMDFPESRETKRFVVKYGVDSTLDEKKRTYDKLPELMSDVARNEIPHLSNDIKECSVAYLPQIGYLLSVPMTEHMKLTNNYELPNLTFMFTSNNCVYYKSRYTSELDDSLGDTLNVIYDLELQIMLKLQSEVLKNCQIMTDVMKYSGQLDCLIAMAKVAKEFSYVQPTVNHDDLIYIKKGRHPLQELRTATFVPNDTLSGGDDGSKLIVLTGPNSSGKSVYLKQVAIIVFMAQIGSYVPAEEAVIGAVDAIYTRMYTSESVSIGLSTFMIDLNQISLAVRNATQHSLVVIDEFGKGTSATDGMALLAATLNFWIDQRIRCPYVFVSTHIYGVIKWLHQSPIICFKTFETMLERDELVYLFRLIDGTGSISYASQVAKKAGFSHSDYVRSLEVTKALCDSKPISTRSDFFEDIFQKAKAEVELFLQLDLDNEKDVNNWFELMRDELEDEGKSSTKKSEAENPIPNQQAIVTSSLEE